MTEREFREVIRTNTAAIQSNTAAIERMDSSIARMDSSIARMDQSITRMDHSVGVMEHAVRLFIKAEVRRERDSRAMREEIAEQREQLRANTQAVLLMLDRLGPAPG